MNPTLLILLNHLRSQGHAQYDGEAVTQLAHALQAASLALEHQASPELVTACLFHDLGHLLNKTEDGGTDDRHEYRALGILRSVFPAAVTEPIRLHVEAKRYLCAVEPGYWQGLSAESQRSLVGQGGVFAPSEAALFIAQPHAEAAVQLRRWDEQAKVVRAVTPNLEVFAAIAHTCCYS
ncbi:MAG: phosphohydrolase [Leptolyngbyaceae cyanobacterium SL_7_1]|nr:phosphohydrolase [Leptolyngbyaceae cyanobacterium SL_7_1]